MHVIGLLVGAFCGLVALAVAVALEIYLSKRENKWLGLILPMLSFLWSWIYPLQMFAPSGITVSLILQLIVVLLLANVPTIVLMAVYFICRGKFRRKKQLAKMNIQDLG